MGFRFRAWTDEQSAVLIELIAAGKSSAEAASALNEQFGATHTRNSVIGKCNRLGITRPGKPQQAPPKPREPRVRIVRVNSNSNAMRAVTTAPAKSADYKLRCVEIVPLNLSLIELEPHHCRYPYGGFVREGEPELPITFCGHPKIEGSSYCVPHFHLCRQDSPPRRISLGAAA